MADRKERGGHGAQLRALNNSNIYQSSQISVDDGDSAESSSRAQQGNVYRQPEPSPEVKECSMCGDVGISEELFQCHRCRYRYQHIYCSRSYPDLGAEIWICNWCLHEDGKIQGDQQLKQLKLSKTSDDVGRTAKSAFEILLQVAQSLPENLSPGGKIPPPTAVANESDIASSIHVHKRQRCNPAVPMDTWRPKKRLQLNSPRGIARRYKLLADVLC